MLLFAKAFDGVQIAAIFCVYVLNTIKPLVAHGDLLYVVRSGEGIILSISESSVFTISHLEPG